MVLATFEEQIQELACKIDIIGSMRIEKIYK